MPEQELEPFTGLPMPTDDGTGMPANPYFQDEDLLGQFDTPEEDVEESRKAFEALVADVPEQGEVRDARELEARLAGEEPEAVPEPEGEKEPLSAEEVERRATAFAGLQRAGLEVDDFADEDRAIAKGLKLAEAQAKTDEKFGDLRGKVREAKEVSADPGLAVAPGQTGGPTLDALKAVLKEEFGDDVAGKLAPLLAPKPDATAQRLERELETVTGWMQGMIVDGYRSKDERLSDKATWKRVQPQFEALAKSEAYQGPEGLRTALDHATRIVLGAPASPEQVREKRETDDAKAAGRLESSRRRETPKALTSEEREYQGYLRAFEMSKRAEGAVFGST